ncbi:MAG: Vacuolar protein sorting-associated protein 41 [Pycnora praestabilis]|nr:MAG: Vacuolar protein sorting-associated protein 41 [Pycnora praestabilis]
MAPDPEEIEPGDSMDESSSEGQDIGREESHGDEDDDDDDDDDDEEEEDEPKLKYSRLTGSLGAVYRNGDATSTFLVAGDKMIIGTHNGNIHVLSVPSFQSLRVYHAHSASVTAISVSPFPPPLPSGKPDPVNKLASQLQGTPARPSSVSSAASPSTRSPRQPPVPLTPSNSIHIATSSIDGNVCVSSLVDPKDVMLRNFARPVQAVALSPDFKNDRAYLSGGLAGNLILTVGGKSGTSSTSSTTGSAAASASGWLGSIGLGSNTGKDMVLHSGEGAISTIKWSVSGKFVVWINEHGIKIMRSSLHLEAADSESAWKRIAHVDHPGGPKWEEMSSVWRGRAEWTDVTNLESDEDSLNTTNGYQIIPNKTSNNASTQKLPGKSSRNRGIEKLVIGWGDTVWIINVHPGGAGVGKEAGERTVGRAETVTILRTDCIVSGLSLYTPSLLLVLAYITHNDIDEKDHNPSPPGKGKHGHTASTGSGSKRGLHHRQNALSPELRLIDLATSEEVDADTLTVSRFESLSATDYHLGILPASRVSAALPAQRGAFEAIGGLGGGLWDASVNATRLFSSNASVLSNDSQSDKAKVSKVPSGASVDGASIANRRGQETTSIAMSIGMKIYIHSPYDCVLATKRDLSDHLSWLLAREKYKESWELIDEHPEVISSAPERLSDSLPVTPTKAQASLSDFFDDDASQATESASRAMNSAVEKEKRRIGEQWVQQLVDQGDWIAGGKLCGKVLGTSSRWEHWVWVFAQADKFDEITPFIPRTELHPPIPSLVYEVVLGHYISVDRLRLKELLDEWPPELFDIRSVTGALDGKLRSGDVREDSMQDGQRGQDWRILMEGMAKLLLADGQAREALRCYIRLQNADAAMALIRDYHLLDAVSDDIPGLIFLRVSKEQMRKAPISELEEATLEPIKLLVDEAHHGIVRPEVVVSQLEENHALFLFFYFRALWKGDSTVEQSRITDQITTEGKSIVEEFGDLVVELFAEYDRTLLMDFLKASQSYTYNNALGICERRDYIPELVYLLSKTGNTKRALTLIIDRLQDVSQAISFAKEQDDPDLWNDLLNYSMDKPRFIRGLLEEVGTAIDPITLVRRIPEGLEIEGLREGLSRMIKEYEIQFSISEGVARVLRGEVAIGMDTLRTGQKKGVKFDVLHHDQYHRSHHAKVEQTNGGEHVNGSVETTKTSSKTKPGHCVGCLKPFTDNEKEILVGFACGDVFHLPCLLKRGKTEEQDQEELHMGVSFDVDTNYFSRSVGAKVTHARIIRDKIADGCPIVWKSVATTRKTKPARIVTPRTGPAALSEVAEAFELLEGAVFWVADATEEIVLAEDVERAALEVIAYEVLLGVVDNPASAEEPATG